jgi:hypothetical protein
LKESRKEEKDREQSTEKEPTRPFFLILEELFYFQGELPGLLSPACKLQFLWLDGLADPTGFGAILNSSNLDNFEGSY